jgi:hypothetical protein
MSYGNGASGRAEGVSTTEERIGGEGGSMEGGIVVRGGQKAYIIRTNKQTNKQTNV